MGRDLINRIPRLNKASLELRSAVESCAEDLLANLDEIVESQLAEPEDEPRSSYEEGEIVIFPGFKENQPAILVKQQAVPPKAGLPTVSSELEIVRETIQRELNEIAADKVADINLERNRHMEFKIKLINPNTSPIRSKSRLLPNSIKEQVGSAIFEQLEAGLIRHSRSEWASPLHIVMKPDNTIRITVDYKRLKNVIEFDPYPMPDASEMYKELADSNWFSKFDFFKAYHQIPVSPDCIKFTAFICEWGLFEYPSMPLGIKTAAAWFQRCIDVTFKSLIVKGSLRGFLDDMVLFSRNLQDHLVDALELIRIMKNATLKVSLKKCELAQEEVTFLGKVISRNKVKNCPRKAECIRNMPLAISYKSLQSALGIFNYQRPFIQNYAEHAQPLYDMLEVKNVPKKFIKNNGLVNGKFILNWTASQISQFELMKKLTSKLFHPDFRYPMNARSDASDKGYGGYVFQDIDGQRRVLGYLSRTYTRAQRNYSAGERELLSIFKLIEEFHIILFGRHFTIYTDHLPLTFLFAKAEPSKRLQRWFENLASYSFTIKYIPGAENTVADALSRLYDDIDDPEPAFSDEDFNDIIIANLQQETSDLVNRTSSTKLDKPLLQC